VDSSLLPVFQRFKKLFKQSDADKIRTEPVLFDLIEKSTEKQHTLDHYGGEKGNGIFGDIIKKGQEYTSNNRANRVLPQKMQGGGNQGGGGAGEAGNVPGNAEPISGAGEAVPPVPGTPQEQQSLTDRSILRRRK